MYSSGVLFMWLNHAIRFSLLGISPDRSCFPPGRPIWVYLMMPTLPLAVRPQLRLYLHYSARLIYTDPHTARHGRQKEKEKIIWSSVAWLFRLIGHSMGANVALVGSTSMRRNKKWADPDTVFHTEQYEFIMPHFVVTRKKGTRSNCYCAWMVVRHNINNLAYT